MSSTRCLTRREFTRLAVASVAGAAIFPRLSSSAAAADQPPLFRISLAEWSLHKKLQKGELDNLDFAKVAKEEFGIDGIEYVNQFFMDKAEDQKYLGELKQRATDHGVKSLLIMCDREGNLGDPDNAKRNQAVENHKKWVEAAAFLGCHSIRVNAASGGSYEEQLELAADGLRKLTQFAEQHQLSVLVENHGGLSSNAAWLSEVMRRVDHPHCGTLPDFGNFGIDRNKGEWYDRYKGVEELMPFAHAVSAKSHEFDDAHPLVTYDRKWKQETDFLKMMKIVLAAGYNGYVGIEYEGSELDEYEGIRKTKAILEKCRAEFRPA
ncbi:MAG: sugar phosphate isomerase/epimerase family protein [Planctomycetaceae bacterium]